MTYIASNGELYDDEEVYPQVIISIQDEFEDQNDYSAIDDLSLLWERRLMV